MILLLFLLIAFGIGFLLNKLLLKFASNLGIRSQNDAIIRWSSQAKPSIGGIPFFIVFLIAGAFYAYLSKAPESIFDDAQLGIFLSCSLGFFLGLSDDAYNTRPLLKFGAQILCAVILILADIFIYISPNMALNYALTVFWVVALMNSINMLDNMDGITTVTSIFILLNTGILMASKSGIQSLDGAILVSVLGCMLSFLIYNWHPSKMFMGDTGSQFLGVFLAAFGIKYIWNYVPMQGMISQTEQLALVLLIFVLPITDTATVTINRLRRGQSPFVGGKDHTTHNLSYLGFGDSQIAIIFVIISIISTVMILTIVSSIDHWTYLNFWLFASYFGVVFVTLYGVTQSKRAKTKFHENEARRQSAGALRVEYSDRKEQKLA